MRDHENPGAEPQGRSDLYLVSCVGLKRSTPAPAEDLFTSSWFQKARQYVERTRAPWFILSAEHGFVAPDEILPPYNRTLNNMGVAERRAWAQTVRGQMDARLPDVKRIVIWHKYRENLMDYLHTRAAIVEVPLEGLGIGQQLAWLTKAIAE